MLLNFYYLCFESCICVLFKLSPPIIILELVDRNQCFTIEKLKPDIGKPYDHVTIITTLVSNPQDIVTRQTSQDHCASLIFLFGGNYHLLSILIYKNYIIF